MSALSDFVQDIVCVDPTAQPNAPTEMPPTEPAPYAGEGPYNPQMPEIPRNRVPNIPEPPARDFAPGGGAGRRLTPRPSIDVRCHARADLRRRRE
jgi:hypothetical protein